MVILLKLRHHIKTPLFLGNVDKNQPKKKGKNHLIVVINSVLTLKKKEDLPLMVNLWYYHL